MLVMYAAEAHVTTSALAVGSKAGGLCSTKQTQIS